MAASTEASELPTIDQTVLTDLVREALHHDAAEVATWQCHELHSGGAGSRIFRVKGEANAGGARLPWSLVVKILDLKGEGLKAAGAEPDAWNYWKREWLVYQAPWLHQLPGGVVAPRCLGAAEIPGIAAWVALEDLQRVDQRPWSLAKFRTVAQHIGAFNGAYLAGRTMPTDAWLSRGWLRGWTERAAPMVSILPTVADHPCVRQVISGTMITELLRLWEERDAVYAALHALPQTLCHLDAFPRNVFVRPTANGDQSVAIDWAFCGQAAIGEELGALIGASLVFFEADPGAAFELEAQCVRGYLDGLRDAGWRGDEADVHFGALAALGLRFGVGALAPILTITLDETTHGLMETIFGRPFGAIIRNLAAMMAYQEQRIVEMRRVFTSR